MSFRFEFPPFFPKLGKKWLLLDFYYFENVSLFIYRARAFLKGKIIIQIFQMALQLGFPSGLDALHNGYTGVEALGHCFDHLGRVKDAF